MLASDRIAVAPCAREMATFLVGRAARVPGRVPRGAGPPRRSARAGAGCGKGVRISAPPGCPCPRARYRRA
ncbi:unnamed protein product [Spirodela intermedia]|uniref:Uncharacterized protein n=1 Tax=Spirodela intermedia TaxID=51605 RepID=A0ABN7E7Y0_SPIIN|nr:unnamed protein product [Spirodela intermedia]